MLTARFQFLPDLNEFLPHEQRSGSFDYCFEPGQSVKHLSEAAGIPHTEIGRIEVHRQPVDFSYQAQDGDEVVVHPATVENSPLPVPPRFVLDNHLGRLAAYLRMLGFNSLYRNNFNDLELAEISAAEERVLLTRDRRLLMRKIVRFGYCLRSLDSRQQLLEVSRRYALADQLLPFRRCLRCNGMLQPVCKAAVLDRLEPLTQKHYDEFAICPACGQIYWKGSHYEYMQGLIAQVKNHQKPPNEPGAAAHGA